MFIDSVKYSLAVKPLSPRVALFFSVMKAASLFLIATAVLFSCTSKSKKKATENTASNSLPQTGLALDNRFGSADSLVFVFFNDPFTPDSLQYTRYYKQYSTTVPADIQSVLAALNSTFTKEERPRPCRNEGKAWIFSKNKIFQTVYFGWSKNNCAFIYLIKDGFFYYTDIKTAFISTLTNSKAKATEP